MKHIFLVICTLFASIHVASQIDNEYLKVGEKAPLINGIDQFGKNINSTEILKEQKILLLFYRGNWCPYCRKHLKSLQEHLTALTAKGYYVLVVSPEKPEKTKETSKKVNASFSILHDSNTTIMNAYKVAFDVNDKNVTSYYKYTKSKITAYNQENSNTLPVPATYIIGKDGKIAFVHYDPDYTNRKDIREILNMK